MAHVSVGAMIRQRITDSGGDPALKVKSGDGWKSVTWADLGARMERIAAGLMTIQDDQLVQQRSHIAILGNTSEDWITCDFAALSIGLITVPVYATLLTNEVGYLLQDTGSVVAIVENGAQLDKVREAQKGFTFFDKEYPAESIKVQHIVVMDPTGVAPAEDWESLADLEKRGQNELERLGREPMNWAKGPVREQTCTYTYTSGTTGPPKGVIQTHENMLAMLESVDETGLFRKEVADGGLFLFLPLAHSFGRLIELAGPFFNGPIIISGVPTLVDDLGATLPGFFPAAPRVYEKMKSRIETAVAGASGFRQAMFNWAINTGKATIPYRSKGEPLPGFLQFKLNLADKLVLSKLRDRLGFTNAYILLSGSAPLSVEVHEFFLAMQLNVLEAYGLTETCPGLTTNLPSDFRLGTVGKAFPGVQLKIAEDGEILAKGNNITGGYINREAATKEAFDDDGWFLTGDLGSLDEDGFLKITGRKKELMKTSGGKFIAPNKIEGKLKLLPLIQEAVTVADTRNFATALIAIDDEELQEWAAQTGNEANRDSDAVKAAVQAHIDNVNEQLARYETIKYFRIVPAMTVEDGLLTASLKVKRKIVYDRYADLIEEMYSQKKG